MKPYCAKQSPRPGCACCNTKDAHGLRNDRASEGKTAGKRNGKKAVRQSAKRDLKKELAAN